MSAPRASLMRPIRFSLLGFAIAVAPAVFMVRGEVEAQTLGAVGIDSVIIVGNRVFQTAPLLGTIAIFPGDTIGFREVQAAEKRLWETGSFNDITVTASESPDGLVTLTFEVDEHPVVRARSIEGLGKPGPRRCLGPHRPEPGTRLFTAALRAGKAVYPRWPRRTGNPVCSG